MDVIIAGASHLIPFYHTFQKSNNTQYTQHTTHTAFLIPNILHTLLQMNSNSYPTAISSTSEGSSLSQSTESTCANSSVGKESNSNSTTNASTGGGGDSRSVNNASTTSARKNQNQLNQYPQQQLEQRQRTHTHHTNAHPTHCTNATNSATNTRRRPNNNNDSVNQEHECSTSASTSQQQRHKHSSIINSLIHELELACINLNNVVGETLEVTGTLETLLDDNSDNDENNNSNFRQKPPPAPLVNGYELKRIGRKLDKSLGCLESVLMKCEEQSIEEDDDVEEIPPLKLSKEFSEEIVNDLVFLLTFSGNIFSSSSNQTNIGSSSSSQMSSTSSYSSNFASIHNSIQEKISNILSFPKYFVLGKSHVNHLLPFLIKTLEELEKVEESQNMNRKNIQRHRLYHHTQPFRHKRKSPLDSLFIKKSPQPSQQFYDLADDSITTCSTKSSSHMIASKKNVSNTTIQVLLSLLNLALSRNNLNTDDNDDDDDEQEYHENTLIDELGNEKQEEQNEKDIDIDGDSSLLLTLSPSETLNLIKMLIHQGHATKDLAKRWTPSNKHSKNKLYCVHVRSFIVHLLHHLKELDSDLRDMEVLCSYIHEIIEYAIDSIESVVSNSSYLSQPQILQEALFHTFVATRTISLSIEKLQKLDSMNDNTLLETLFTTYLNFISTSYHQQQKNNMKQDHSANPFFMIPTTKEGILYSLAMLLISSSNDTSQCENHNETNIRDAFVHTLVHQLYNNGNNQHDDKVPSSLAVQLQSAASLKNQQLNLLLHKCQQLIFRNTTTTTKDLDDGGINDVNTKRQHVHLYKDETSLYSNKKFKGCHDKNESIIDKTNDPMQRDYSINNKNSKSDGEADLLFTHIVQMSSLYSNVWDDYMNNSGSNSNSFDSNETNNSGEVQEKEEIDEKRKSSGGFRNKLSQARAQDLDIQRRVKSHKQNNTSGDDNIRNNGNILPPSFYGGKTAQFAQCLQNQHPISRLDPWHSLVSRKMNDYFEDMENVFRDVGNFTGEEKGENSTETKQNHKRLFKKDQKVIAEYIQSVQPHIV